MATGLYHATRDAGETYQVRMDEVGFYDFNGQIKCVGTDNLNACTVVTIVSPHGAIFASIAPDDPKTASPDHPVAPPLAANNNHSNNTTNMAGGPQMNDFGQRHMRMKMAQVEHLFHQYQNYFQRGRSAWVVCALYQGHIAVPEQKGILEGALANLGLEFASAAYSVAPRPGVVMPPKGTVFVDARGERPVVYVEDVAVSA